MYQESNWPCTTKNRHNVSWFEVVDRLHENSHPFCHTTTPPPPAIIMLDWPEKSGRCFMWSKVTLHSLQLGPREWDNLKVLWLFCCYFSAVPKTSKQASNLTYLFNETPKQCVIHPASIFACALFRNSQRQLCQLILEERFAYFSLSLLGSAALRDSSFKKLEEICFSDSQRGD